MYKYTKTHVIKAYVTEIKKLEKKKKKKKKEEEERKPEAY